MNIFKKFMRWINQIECDRVLNDDKTPNNFNCKGDWK